MKNKKYLNKLGKSYFKLPNKIIDNGLSATAIALYTYLAKLPEESNPSVVTMARNLKLSNNTVIKYLKELQDRNIIKQYERGAEKKVSKYEFIKMDEWK